MDVQVETKITAVTVYPDRARVTAAGSCQLQSGTQRLLVDELPLVLEPESVRVTGEGEMSVRILGVDVTRRHYSETPAAQVRELEQRIEERAEKLVALLDEDNIWQAQAKQLAGLRGATTEYAQGIAKGQMTVQRQAELLDFLRERELEVRNAQRTLKQQQNEVNKELDKLRRELKALQSARPRQRFQAKIEVEVSGEGEFTPQLSYVVRQASWQPLYDLRLLEEDNGRLLELSYIASIQQNTGEDWQGVTLAVSTARPALNQRLPELQPWYVDVFVPRPPAPQRTMMRSMAAAPQAAVEEMAFAAAAPAPAPKKRVKAEAVEAVVQEGGGETAVSFRLPSQGDVPSDGSPHKSLVSRTQLPAKIDYLAVPKHTDAVYRRATVMNEGAGPLLGGQASLFVGEEYIGRTLLKYTPTGGEIELMLGVEERITVKREMIKRDVDKRLLRDNRQIRYGYKIELENLLATSANVEVHDHIPVPRHEQIKVKLEDSRPEPSEKSELNLLEWQVQLAAKGELTLRYDYLVEHPRSLQVRGLVE